ncbi:MAG: hypothetical protein ACLQED_12715 [Desulfobaccales bacterium]
MICLFGHLAFWRWLSEPKTGQVWVINRSASCERLPQPARNHLGRVQDAWDEPTDWTDLSIYGFLCLEAAIMAAAKSLGYKVKPIAIKVGGRWRVYKDRLDKFLQGGGEKIL